jgi:hypothetical protein
MRDRHRADQNEIAIFVFSVTAKDFSHGVLLDREDRHFGLPWKHESEHASLMKGTGTPGSAM